MTESEYQNDMAEFAAVEAAVAALKGEGLNARAAHILVAEGITSKAEAVAFGVINIEKLPGLGATSHKRIKEWLISDVQKPKNTGQFGPGNPGKPKGATNKVTREFKATVQKLLEDNADNVGAWLVQVAQGHGENKADPAKALDLLAKLAEFAAPKLGRMEHTGANGGPMQYARVERKIIDPKQ